MLFLIVMFYSFDITLTGISLQPGINFIVSQPIINLHQQIDRTERATSDILTSHSTDCAVVITTNKHCLLTSVIWSCHNLYLRPAHCMQDLFEMLNFVVQQEGLWPKVEAEYIINQACILHTWPVSLNLLDMHCSKGFSCLVSALVTFEI